MTTSNDHWEDSLKREIMHGVAIHRAKCEGIADLMKPEVSIQDIIMEAEKRGADVDRICNIVSAAQAEIDWDSLVTVLNRWLPNDDAEDAAEAVVLQITTRKEVDEYLHDWGRVRFRSLFLNALFMFLLAAFFGCLGFAAAWSIFGEALK